MKSAILLMILSLSMLTSGCAATGTGAANVLSGDAPQDLVVRKADQATASGDYEAAVVLYRQALHQKPEADVWYRLGRVYARLGQPELALRAYDSALEVNDRHQPSLQAAGLYLTTRDRAGEARPYLDRLLRHDRHNWRVHNALGVLADLEGRFDEATDHYRAAIDIYTDAPMLWNNLGFSYYLAGDHRQAIVHMGKALQLDPDYKPARHNVALVFARMDKYDEALQVMLSAGEAAQAYADVGYLALKMGDYDTAESLLAEAIRRSGTYNRQAHQNLALVRKARAEEDATL